jgi:hypothetical protein
VSNGDHRGRGRSIDPGTVLASVATAPQLYVGVRVRSGPHVTPELFTVSGGRIVCLTSVSTLKVKSARQDGVVALAALGADGMVVGTANATVIDPADVGALLRDPVTTVSSPLGVARFVRDNLAEAAGGAIDAVAGRLGLPPERRVVLSLELMDAEVRAHAGEDVMLGWTRSGGAPLVLPARWEDDHAFVSRDLFDAMSAVTSSSACVTMDETTGLGPTGKRGVMLRGEGRSAVDGDVVRIELDVERTSYWDGTETGTVVDEEPS